MGKVKVGYSISKEISEKLKDEAGKRDISQSDLVERAVMSYLTPLENSVLSKKTALEAGAVNEASPGIKTAPASNFKVRQKSKLPDFMTQTSADAPSADAPEDVQEQNRLPSYNALPAHPQSWMPSAYEVVVANYFAMRGMELPPELGGPLKRQTSDRPTNIPQSDEIGQSPIAQPQRVAFSASYPPGYTGPPGIPVVQKGPLQEVRQNIVPGSSFSSGLTPENLINDPFSMIPNPGAPNINMQLAARALGQNWRQNLRLLTSQSQREE